MISIFIVVVLLFTLPLIIGSSVKDNDLKSKLFKGYIFFFIICIVAVPLLATLIEDNFTSSNAVSKADGFTIEGYEVILDVGIDNRVEVTENIDINFYETGHHGIYKFTPTWLEYTGKDNKTIKRKANIYNYRAEGDNYVVDIVKKDKERIKIGSASETIFGDHRYTIKYTYDMGKDPFNGFDEFIFHAFGDFWGTSIKNPRVVIHMPKEISNYDIKVFKDKYRQDNASNLITTSIDGKTIIIESKYYFDKSLTIDISLPEGYFVGGSWNYGWISTIISGIVILLTIYVIISWLKYGKNFEKKVPTIEFYAPDELSSAEIGYIYNKMQSSKKLTISLIIQLASKGYLKIDEIKEGKKKTKIQISKLYIKPKMPVIDKSEDVPKRVIEIKKLKEPDDSLSSIPLTRMKYFFKNGDTKKIEANVNSFLEVKDVLVNGGYVKILSDNWKDSNNSQIDATIKKKQEKREKELAKYNEELAKYNEELAKYNEEVAKLPKRTALENIVYGNLFSVGDVIILSEHTSFYKTFSDIEKELKSNFKKKIHDDEARKHKIKAFVISFITIIISLMSFYLIEDMDPSWSILYFIAFGCCIVNLFFAFIMGRKTGYGEAISARVKGFREFLTTAEKDKLEALVEKNPHYFYDILPYTYVLNISKKWINKFEDIKMPEVNMGSFDYGSDVSFHSIFDNVYYPVYTSTSSSGGGCSSCGGGCSSCGGGCSSCGGGGSW